MWWRFHYVSLSSLLLRRGFAYVFTKNKPTTLGFSRRNSGFWFRHQLMRHTFFDSTQFFFSNLSREAHECDNALSHIFFCTSNLEEKNAYRWNKCWHVNVVHWFESAPSVYTAIHNHCAQCWKPKCLVCTHYTRKTCDEITRISWVTTIELPVWQR